MKDKEKSDLMRECVHNNKNKVIMTQEEKTKLMKKCVHTAYDRGYKTGYMMAEHKILHELNLEWSEEDEKMMDSIICSLTRISHNTRTDATSPNYIFFEEINWLKSLKQRMKGE